MKKNKKLFIVAIITVTVVAFANTLGYKNLNFLVFGQQIILSSQIMKNLESTDRHLAISSLSILGKRGNESGMEFARGWLYDEHDWLHGALYIGSFEKKESVPYLIKGLSHPYASGLYPDIYEMLVRLTAQDFGMNKARWIEWWKVNHPDKQFEFSTENIDIPPRYRNPNETD